MKFKESVSVPVWLQKIFNYEYWPWYALYVFVFPYFLYLAIKSKSLTFFTNVNPSIFQSGFKNYSKYAVLELIPQIYKPKGILVDANGLSNAANFTFPLIAKPDIGERGKGVEIIHNEIELNGYLKNAFEATIVQEMITLPNEAALFYFKYPNEKNGVISSFTTKEFLSVKGDGKSNVKTLMEMSLRAKLQIERYDDEFLNQIPKEGVLIKIEAIGNHCRGTKFINSNHLITDKLTKSFDEICSKIDGFYYGRFDLKYNTFEELERGENIKIVELNGVSADPAHIFDQAVGLLQSLKSIIYHWSIMYKISSQNKANGIPFTPLKEVVKFMHS